MRIISYIIFISFLLINTAYSSTLRVPVGKMEAERNQSATFVVVMSLTEGAPLNKDKAAEYFRERRSGNKTVLILDRATMKFEIKPAAEIALGAVTSSNVPNDNSYEVYELKKGKRIDGYPQFTHVLVANLLKTVGRLSGHIEKEELEGDLRTDYSNRVLIDDESARVKEWNEKWRSELRNPKVEGPSSLARQLVKEKKIKDGQEILSLGVGYGEDEIYFVENIDCEVIATDFSQVVIDYIGNIVRQRNLEFKGKLKAKSQDMTKQFDFRDNSFDVVYAHQSLMYFLDDEKMLSVIREIHRVLKPGGKVFISVRSTDDWKYAENPKAKDNIATGEDGITRRFFDRRSLKELFERLNFGDITIEENVIDRYKNESPATVLYLFASKRASFLLHNKLRDQI